MGHSLFTGYVFSACACHRPVSPTGTGTRRLSAPVCPAPAHEVDGWLRGSVEIQVHARTRATPAAPPWLPSVTTLLRGPQSKGPGGASRGGRPCSSRTGTRTGGRRGFPGSRSNPCPARRSAGSKGAGCHSGPPGHWGRLLTRPQRAQGPLAPGCGPQQVLLNVLRP